MPCFSSVVVVVWLDDQMTMDEYTRDILLGLNSLRTCGNFCDINMVATDGTKFPVHRCILAAASTNLYQYAIDVQSDVCVDIDANILEIFLDILYTGKVSPLCDKNDIDKLKEISNTLRMDCVLNLLNEKDETEQSINDEMACCSQKTSSCQNMNAIPMHKKKRGRPRKRNDVTLEENDKKRLKLDDTILDSTEKPSKRYLPKRATRGKTGLERLKIINSMRNDSSQQLKRHSVYDESMYVEFSDEVQSVNPGDCIDKCLDTTCSDLYDKDTAIYVENNDEDPEIFAKKVSTSLSQILSQLQTSVSSCTTLSENEKHSDTEKREEWKNCPYCSKFKGIKKGRYQFHIRFCHLPLKCVHCFKPFESEYDAKQHCCPLTKPETLPHVCELCGKTLAGIQALKLHLKIHNNVKNYKCQFCSKAFVRKVQLDSHIKHIHKQDRPFKCLHCEKKFAYNYELKRHKSSHQCPHCSALIPGKQALSVHIRTCYSNSNFTTNRQEESGALLKATNRNIEHKSSIDDTATVSKTIESNILPNSAVNAQEVLDIENINNLFMCKFCECIFPEYKDINEHFELNQCRAQCPSDNNVQTTGNIPVYLNSNETIIQSVPQTEQTESVQYLIIEDGTELTTDDIDSFSIKNLVQTNPTT